MDLATFNSAAYNGQTTAVERLIERGADINAKTKDGYTALIYAAYSGHAKIVQELVENGASIDATNNYGSTALIYAAHKVKVKFTFFFNSWLAV